MRLRVVTERITHADISRNLLSDVSVANEVHLPSEGHDIGGSLELYLIRPVIARAVWVGEWHIGNLHGRDNDTANLGISKDQPPTRLAVLQTLSVLRISIVLGNIPRASGVRVPSQGQ